MEYELYHYGVKGMKWGVRKQIDRVGRRIRNSKFVQEELRRAQANSRSKAQLYAYKSQNARFQYARDRAAGKSIRAERHAENLKALQTGKKIKVKNIAKTMVMNPATEGRIARYKDIGYTQTYSVLKAYGREAIHGPAIVGAVGIGAGVIVGRALLKNAKKRIESGKDDWGDVLNG